MKCAYCGKNNKDGALYCKRCGIGLPPSPPPGGPDKAAGDPGTAIAEPLPNAYDGQPAPQPAAAAAKASDKKRASKAKKQFIAVVAVLLLIAAAVLAIVIAVSLKGEILPGGNSYTVRSEYGGIAHLPVVVYRGELIEPDANGITKATCSLDGSTAGILTGDKLLFCLRGGKQYLAARYVTDFAVSVSGSNFIYRDENGLLWSFDCGEPDNAPVCICNDLVSDRFAVSPDGKTVVFGKQTDSMMYLYSDKKISTVADKLYPLAVSNNARHIWAFNESENAFYHCDKRGNPVYIRDNPAGGANASAAFNSTHEEMTFSCLAGDGVCITMVCMGGAQPIEVKNASSMLYPVCTVSGLQTVREAGRFLAVTYPYKSFEGRVFAGGELVRFSKEGSVTLEPKPCLVAQVSDDYNTLCYVCEHTLIRRDLSGKTKPEKLAENVSYFLMANNGSKLWYRTQDGVLVCVKGNTSTPIAPGVGTFVITPNGNDALFMRDNFVCRNNGGNPNASYLFGDAPCEGLLADSHGLYANLGGQWRKITTGGEKVSWEMGQ